MKSNLLKKIGILCLVLVCCGVSAAQVGGYGTIETVGEGTDAITLLRVGGTRYEMGYRYGYYLADQMAGCWSGFDGIFTEQQYADATAAMWNSAYFDTAGYEQELNGMAAGCAAAGHPELTFEILRQFQLIPDMSEAGCGLFAAWGDATEDGHLYQLRNLDWSMDLGVQNYPVVVVYEPDDGNRHAVIGFAGMIGAAGGGIGDKGIAVSEIMGGFGDAEGTFPIPFPGVPFTFLLRDCLYHDSTLQQALDRIYNATRTNEYHYCVSGPDGSGNPDARLLFTSSTRFDEFGGGDEVLPHPYYAEVFYTPRTDLVYWKRHDGGAYAMPGPEDDRKGNQTLYAAIDARYGSIDAAAAIEIAQADSVSGTVMSIVYDTTALKFWVAFAEGSDPAPNQGYVEFSLPGPAVTYRIGESSDLLDSTFYAGEDYDGSNVAGRMAFWGCASNDNTKVAFLAMNRNTSAWSVFLVDIGDPTSWRRLTADGVAGYTLSWSPDDSRVFAAGWRITVATGTVEQPTVCGYALADMSVTRLPRDNWLLTYPLGIADGDIVALPILTDGSQDWLRQPTILTTLPIGTFEATWPQVAPDGSAVAFYQYRGLPTPDPPHAIADTYVLTGVPAIMAAPRVPDTDVSTLAATWPGDARIVAIEEDENPSYGGTFSEDKKLVLYCEDWSLQFTGAGAWWNEFPSTDFDVMVAPLDGSSPRYRIADPGNQAMISATPGGTRVVYIADAGTGAMHLYIGTLDVVTNITGTDLGNNDILTTEVQQASDGSGTVVVIPSGTTVNFPSDAPQEIQISTPINPATQPQLPEGVDALPVIREFGPTDTQFNPAITVTISYTDAEIEGLDEPNLRVFLYNDVTEVYDFEVTTITDHDLVNNTISFTVDHFSKFGLGAPLDTDGDGIPDATDPDDDNDGVPDGDDTYPLDTDNDGLDNADDPDDDADGMPDGDDLYPLDTDNDELGNDVDPDDDNDGLLDSVEVNGYGTDPLDADTDDDGLSDGIEVTFGLNPLVPNPGAALPLRTAFPVAMVLLLASLVCLTRAHRRSEQ